MKVASTGVEEQIRRRINRGSYTWIVPLLKTDQTRDDQGVQTPPVDRVVSFVIQEYTTYLSTYGNHWTEGSRILLSLLVYS